MITDAKFRSWMEMEKDGSAQEVDGGVNRAGVLKNGGLPHQPIGQKSVVFGDISGGRWKDTNTLGCSLKGCLYNCQI